MCFHADVLRSDRGQAVLVIADFGYTGRKHSIGCGITGNYFKLMFYHLSVSTTDEELIRLIVGSWVVYRVIH